MRFTARLTNLNFNGLEFGKKRRAAIEIQVRQATREWMRAVIEQVPLWSGMARGSLKFATGTNGFLAQYLNVAIDSTPTEAGRSRPNKNDLAGGAFGKYSFFREGNKFGFEFEESLPHFLWNDFFQRTDLPRDEQIPSPWNARLAGRDAFIKYMQDVGIHRLPLIQSAITRTTITV